LERLSIGEPKFTGVCARPPVPPKVKFMRPMPGYCVRMHNVNMLRERVLKDWGGKDGNASQGSAQIQSATFCRTRLRLRGRRNDNGAYSWTRRNSARIQGEFAGPSLGGLPICESGSPFLFVRVPYSGFDATWSNRRVRGGGPVDPSQSAHLRRDSIKQRPRRAPFHPLGAGDEKARKGP